MAHLSAPPSPSGAAQAAPAALPLPDPLHTIDQATRRVDASSLDLKGIKTLRVLNESSFLSVLEGMVEERIRSRLREDLSLLPARRPAPPAAEAGPSGPEVRAEYSRRWREFRQRFEEKLSVLEARAEALAADPPPAGR